MIGRSRARSIYLFVLVFAGVVGRCGRVMVDHPPLRFVPHEDVRRLHAGGLVLFGGTERAHHLDAAHPADVALHLQPDVHARDRPRTGAREDVLPRPADLVPAVQAMPPGMDAAGVLRVRPHEFHGGERPRLERAIEAEVRRGEGRFVDTHASPAIAERSTLPPETRATTRAPAG